MKNLKSLLFTAIFIIAIFNVKAQSYVGHSVDNYSGVHSLISNPSNVVDSRLRASINLLSFSAFGGSDYFGINVRVCAEIGMLLGANGFLIFVFKMPLIKCLENTRFTKSGLMPFMTFREVIAIPFFKRFHHG